MNTLFWHYRPARHGLSIVVAPVVALALLILTTSLWSKLGLVTCVASTLMVGLLAWHRSPGNPLKSIHTWIETWHHHLDRTVLGRWLWSTWTHASGRLDQRVMAWNEVVMEVDVAVVVSLSGWLPFGFVYWQGRRLTGWGVRRVWIDDERRSIAIELRDPTQERRFYPAIEDATEYLRYLKKPDDKASDLDLRMLEENRSMRRHNAELVRSQETEADDHRQPTPIRPISGTGTATTSASSLSS